MKRKITLGIAGGIGLVSGLFAGIDQSHAIEVSRGTKDNLICVSFIKDPKTGVTTPYTTSLFPRTILIPDFEIIQKCTVKSSVRVKGSFLRNNTLKLSSGAKAKNLKVKVRNLGKNQFVVGPIKKVSFMQVAQAGNRRASLQAAYDREQQQLATLTDPSGQTSQVAALNVATTAGGGTNLLTQNAAATTTGADFVPSTTPPKACPGRASSIEVVYEDGTKGCLFPGASRPYVADCFGNGGGTNCAPGAANSSACPSGMYEFDSSDASGCVQSAYSNIPGCDPSQGPCPDARSVVASLYPEASAILNGRMPSVCASDKNAARNCFKGSAYASGKRSSFFEAKPAIPGIKPEDFNVDMSKLDPAYVQLDNGAVCINGDTPAGIQMVQLFGTNTLETRNTCSGSAGLIGCIACSNPYARGAVVAVQPFGINPNRIARCVGGGNYCKQ